MCSLFSNRNQINLTNATENKWIISFLPSIPARVFATYFYHSNDKLINYYLWNVATIYRIRVHSISNITKVWFSHRSSQTLCAFKTKYQFYFVCMRMVQRRWTSWSIASFGISDTSYFRLSNNNNIRKHTHTVKRREKWREK